MPSLEASSVSSEEREQVNPLKRPADWLADSGIKGRIEPRLYTRPLRPLNRRTTRGYEVIDFARDVLGEPLTPWQEWFVIHALELNPDGTYRFRTVLLLVARQNGKTHVGKVIALWKLYVDGAKLLLGVGQDMSLAEEKWQACVDTIQLVPELVDELDVVRRKNGDVYFRLDSGARYKISAANRSAGRGLSVDHLDFEELREQRDWAAWSALSKTTNARARAQIFGYSNAGDDLSVVLNHLRDAAIAGQDPSLGLFEWSGAEGCELDDREAIAQANPNLGHENGITIQAILSSLGTDPPAVFRTEVLCQRVDALNAAVDLGAWNSGLDTMGTLESLRDEVVACVDVAPDGEHVTLAVGASMAGGRVRVEIAAAWSSTDDARFKLPDLLRRINPRVIAWYPSGPAAALAPILRPAEKPTAAGRAKPKKARPEVIEIKGTGIIEACMGFADLVAARKVVHPGDPLLDVHVSGAQKMNQGDGWRFVRRGVGHVDAAYAAAGVVHAALTVPVEKPKPRSAVF